MDHYSIVHRLPDPEEGEVAIQKAQALLEEILPDVSVVPEDVELLQACTWVMYGGDPDHVLAKIATAGNSSDSGVCGHVFKNGEPGYMCKTCGYDDTCIVCVRCFRKSNHEGHNTFMVQTVGGGCCDCGDPEAWAEEGCCSDHLGPHQKLKDKEARVSESIEIQSGSSFLGSGAPTNADLDALKAKKSILQQAKEAGISENLYNYMTSTLSRLMHYVTTVLCNCEQLIPKNQEQEWGVVMINDEAHTFDDVITALTSLLEVSADKAGQLAQEIDSVGKTMVFSSTNRADCVEVRQRLYTFRSQSDGDIMEDKPLTLLIQCGATLVHEKRALLILEFLNTIGQESQIMRRMICEQFCAPVDPDDETKYFEYRPETMKRVMGTGNVLLRIDRLLLRDGKLWKEARKVLRKNYIQILIVDPIYKRILGLRYAYHYKTLMDLFLESRANLDDTVLALSVQIFSSPSLALELIESLNFTDQAFDVVFGVLAPTLHTNASGIAGGIDLEHTIIEKNRYPPVFHNLRYILSHKNVQQRISTQSLEKAQVLPMRTLQLLEVFQGMDQNERATTVHVMYESELWISAFAITLELKSLMPFIVDSILGGSPEFSQVSLKMTKERILSWLAKDNIAITEITNDYGTFQVVHGTGPEHKVSVHIPLHRFMCELLVNDRYQGDLASVFEQEKNVKDLGPVNMVQLMEHPIRIMALLAQVRSNMWVRNGFSIKNQVYNYSGSYFRESMYDLDIAYLQTMLATMNGNEFLVSALHTYELHEYFGLSSHDVRSLLPFGPDFGHKLLMCEDFMHLLIVLLTERAHVGNMTTEDIIRREIVQRLFLGPLSYSELTKSIASNLTELEEFDTQLRGLAKLTMPEDTMDHGVYELKEKHHKSFNMYFYHYSRADHEKAMQKVTAIHAEPTGQNLQENPPIPELHDLKPIFKPLLNLLNSRVLHEMIYSILQFCCVHAGDHPDATDSTIDNVLSEALYLLVVAIDQGILDKPVPSDDTHIGAYQVDSLNQNVCQLRLSNQSMLNHLKDLRRRSHKLPLEQRRMIMYISIHLSNSGVINLTPEEEAANMGQQEDEKARRKREAQARRERILANFKLRQQQFIDNHLQLAAEAQETNGGSDRRGKSPVTLGVPSGADDPMDVSGGDVCGTRMSILSSLGDYAGEYDNDTAFATTDHDLTCILCQEQGTTTTLAYVSAMSKSTVLANMGRDTKSLDFLGTDETDPTSSGASAAFGHMHISGSISSSIASTSNRRPSQRGTPSTTTRASSTTNRGTPGTNSAPSQRETPVGNGNGNGVSDNEIVTRLTPRTFDSFVNSVRRPGDSEAAGVNGPRSFLDWEEMEDAYNFNPDLYCASCGHVVHFKCWDRYVSSIREQRGRDLRLEMGRLSSVELNCPLCKSVCNILIPICNRKISRIVKHEIMDGVDAVEFQRWTTERLPYLLINPDRTPPFGAGKEALRPDALARLEAFAHNSIEFLSKASSNAAMNIADPLTAMSSSESVSGEPIPSGTGGAGGSGNGAVDNGARSSTASRAGSLGQAPSSKQAATTRGLAKGIFRMVSMLAYTTAVEEVALRPRGCGMFGSTLNLEQVDRSIVYGMKALVNAIQAYLYATEGQDWVFADWGGVIYGALFAEDPSSSINKSNTVPFGPLLHCDLVTMIVTLLMVVPDMANSRRDTVMLTRLLYLAHIVRTLMLFSKQGMSPESFAIDPDTQSPEIQRDSVALMELWNYVMEAVDLERLHSSPIGAIEIPENGFDPQTGKSNLSLATVVAIHCMPYLRRIALLQYVYYSLPLSDWPQSDHAIADDDEGGFWSEYDRMMAYCSMVNFTEMLSGQGHLTETLGPLFRQWAKHWIQDVPKMTTLWHNPERRLITMRTYSLVPLPQDYSVLFQVCTETKCGYCGRVPQEPALCLVCNRFLCAQGQCCRRPAINSLYPGLIGECSYHAYHCGFGNGVMLLLKQCIILMLSDGRGTFFGAPYLDVHGESDVGLRRGKELRLSTSRYYQLSRLWIRHRVATEIARRMDETGFHPIDWSQF
eukprot:Clim_evm39s148 gene=Clim_evmTU39s148